MTRDFELFRNVQKSLDVALSSRFEEFKAGKKWI